LKTRGLNLAELLKDNDYDFEREKLFKIFKEKSERYLGAAEKLKQRLLNEFTVSVKNPIIYLKDIYQAVALHIFIHCELPTDNVLGIRIESIEKLFQEKAIRRMEAFEQHKDTSISSLNDFMLAAGFASMNKDQTLELIMPDPRMF